MAARSLIDTHSHLLPWVDHGCPDLKTALGMAQAAAASGVKLIVCTPHFPEWNPAKIQYARVVAEQLRAALSNNDIEVHLLLGFEVDLSITADSDMDKIRALCIQGSRGVILFEMPYNGWPLYIEDTIFRLATAGITPVLAHPERNELVQKSSDALLRCVRGGAVIQATAGSLTGEFGNSAIKTFHRLVAEGLVSVLATDAHSFREEIWTMDSMLEALRGRVSEEDLRILTWKNPQLLLQGKPLEQISRTSTPPEKSWRKRRWSK